MTMMIRRFIDDLALRLKRFADAREGVAAVEFALILPVMLLLYVGSIELSDLINVDRRVTVISATVGDLVSRKKETILQSELEDYFNAAEEIITPYDATDLQQVITCIFVDSDGDATVSWSKATSNATPRTDLASVDLPDAVTDISEGKFVILSETSYSYKPLLGLVFETAVDFKRQNVHLPRFGGEIEWEDDT
jgi:Flp pilus assembly protein TadG